MYWTDREQEFRLRRPLGVMSAVVHLADNEGLADEGLLLVEKRTCRLAAFGQSSELLVPLDRELLEEIVELERGRLSAFEDTFDKGR